jgi:hypothetical protein
LKAVLVQCLEQLSLFLKTQRYIKNSVELNWPLDGATAAPLQTIVSVVGLHGIQFGTSALVYGYVLTLLCGVSMIPAGIIYV